MLTLAETTKQDKTNIQTLYQPTHTKTYTLYHRNILTTFSLYISRSTSTETGLVNNVFAMRLLLFNYDLRS